MNTQYEFNRDLLRWYDTNGRQFPWRKGNHSLYKVLVSEILLWKTRAETINNFYPKFFSIYPNKRSLEKSSIEDLTRILQPLGLQNRRAKMLKNVAAGTVRKRITDEQSFRKMFGVGQYIARATLAIYYDVNIVPVDENIRRLLKRVFDFSIRNMRSISKDEDLLLKELINKEHKKVIWAMIDHSSMVCTRDNPACSTCTFGSYCKFYQG